MPKADYRVSAPFNGLRKRILDRFKSIISALVTAWDGPLTVWYGGTIKEDELLIPKFVSVLCPSRDTVLMCVISGEQAFPAQEAILLV